MGCRAWPVWDQVQVAGLSLYVPQHTGGVWELDPYVFRSAATMGAFGLPRCASQKLLPGNDAAHAGRNQGIAPLYFGDYYPLFEVNTSEKLWCGWQFDRPELGRGFAVAFRRSQCSYVAAEVGLRGLDPKARYEVEFRGSYEAGKKRIMTGGELVRLRIEINTTPVVCSPSIGD